MLFCIFKKKTLFLLNYNHSQTSQHCLHTLEAFRILCLHFFFFLNEGSNSLCAALFAFCIISNFLHWFADHCMFLARRKKTTQKVFFHCFV